MLDRFYLNRRETKHQYLWMRLSRLMFGVLVLLSTAAAQQVPFVSATTVQRGTVVSDKYSTTDWGFARQDEVSHNVAHVRVELQTFQKLTSPYEVQCFFVARDPDGNRIVYDVVKKVSGTQSDVLDFFARPLFTSSETKMSRTRDVDLTTGERITLTEWGKAVKVGSTLEGWIVRVVNRGHIVAVEASLSELKQLGKTAVADLNRIAAQNAKAATSQTP